MRILSRFFCLILAVSVIGAIGVQAAHAIDCDALPPRSPRYLDSIAVLQFPGGGAGCWGYTAPDGTQYALMGAAGGVGIVNASALQFVDMVPAEPCFWRELKTYRHYCYAVSECVGLNEGLMIIDLQYLPDSAHLVGNYTGFGRETSHCISIDTAKGYCYLVRQDYSGFRIIDLANPESPVDVGGVTTGDLHDMTVFNDTVYAAEGGRGSFSIWNAANKSNPSLLARVNIPSPGYVHNIWPTADRRFLATTEETVGKTVKIWNREDLSNIQLVATYLGPNRFAHNAHFEGDLLYLSHYSSGVAVLDVTTPECPVQVELFDTEQTPGTGWGCWGVYPHTGGSNFVYASNMDGRLFIFYSKAVWTDFVATPVQGQAPLTVTFTDSSIDAISWRWRFGDGDSSSLQNPVHEYDPGLYTVALGTETAFGVGEEHKIDFITALAETLKVADTMGSPNQSMAWEIRHQNNVPLTDIKLPIQLSNVPAVATFDSVSTVGCRTDYFEVKEELLSQLGNGKIVIRLKADGGGGSPPLAPGDGPIAKVYFKIKNTATAGQQVALTMPPLGVAQHSLSAATLTTVYSPSLIAGTTTVDGTCNCACHGDPLCDGYHDIVDVVVTVGDAFRNMPPVVDGACPHAGRSDINCSGTTDFADVVLIVGIVFRDADAQTSICNPCGP